MSLIASHNSKEVLAKANGAAQRLPDQPLIVIEPSKGWIPLNLNDLWHRRKETARSG